MTFDIDDLSVYRGVDIPVSNKIMVSQPTLGEIQEFSERKYFSAVYNLTAVGADMKWQLWDSGIDYTEIEDYDLFVKLIFMLVSSKKKMYENMLLEKDKYSETLSNLTEEEIADFSVNPLKLILKKSNGESIDLCNFERYIIKDTEEVILYSNEDDIRIDRVVYQKIVQAIRKIHGLKRNNEIPANERTKMDLIEDARDEALASSNKPYKSVLTPLISALTVKCGQCGDDKIWDMKIGMFLDNIKRVGKIQDCELLLQGAYSGFASLKGIDRNRLEWAGELN